MLFKMQHLLNVIIIPFLKIILKEMPQHVWIAILHRIENCQETPVNAKTLITMMELILVSSVILNAILAKRNILQ